MEPPVILFDPYPRSAPMIFGGDMQQRFLRLGRVVGLEESMAGKLPSALVDATLPETVVVVGQTDLDAARLARAPKLKAIVNVEGNFATERRLRRVPPPRRAGALDRARLRASGRRDGAGTRHRSRARHHPGRPADARRPRAVRAHRRARFVRAARRDHELHRLRQPRPRAAAAAGPVPAAPADPRPVAARRAGPRAGRRARLARRRAVSCRG